MALKWTDIATAIAAAGLMLALPAIAGDSNDPPIPARKPAAGTAPPEAMTPAPPAAATTQALVRAWAEQLDPRRPAERSNEPAAAHSPSTRAKDQGPKIHPDLLAWDSGRAVIVRVARQSYELHTRPVSYLWMEFAVLVSRQAAADELIEKEALVKEKIIGMLHDLPGDRLHGAEGKMELKRRMVRVLNEILTSGAAREVYLVDFLTDSHR